MAAYLLRLPDDLHRLARVAAASAGRSLNTWITDAIRVAVLWAARQPEGAAVAALLDEAALHAPHDRRIP